MQRIIPLKKGFVNSVCIFIQTFVDSMHNMHNVGGISLFIMTSKYILLNIIYEYMQELESRKYIDLLQRRCYY